MKCDNCGEEISIWQTGHSINSWTVCGDCHKDHYDDIKAKTENKTQEPQRKKESNPEPEIDWKKLEKITLTTETNTKDLEIKERLGVVSSESALGMNMFRDIFANVRDLVGGQSVSTQKILKDLKSTAFQDIKEQAYKLGADAVVAIDLDYSEFQVLENQCYS